MSKDKLAVLTSELFVLGNLPITDTTISQVRTLVNLFGMDTVYACCKPHTIRSSKRLLSILSFVNESEYKRCNVIEWYYMIGYTNRSGREYYYAELRDEVIEVAPVHKGNYSDAMEMAKAAIENHAIRSGIKNYRVVTA